MSTTVVYNKIGVGYNTTRKADPYLTNRIFALLAPEKDKQYLDIGCGTGNYTIAMAQNGVNITGVDPSDTMLSKAREKDALISWIQGPAETIPLPDNSFDGATGIFTVHHWTDIRKGMAEMSRVLRAGSRFVIFTFTPEQKKGYWFNYFFPRSMERSIAKAMPFQVLVDAAAEAGFQVALTEKYFVQPDLQDMFGYCGKHDPEVYFDQNVRHGTYMFSALNDATEVEEGLQKLRESIDTGTFQTIKQQYENNEGDYLFVVLEKK
jgi:ubiquinone/menaquinone biosynthesis C-methylase UbiE